MEPQESSQTITRVQLGATSLELYLPDVRQAFLNKNWVHLSADALGPGKKKCDLSSVICVLRNEGIASTAKKTFRKVFGRGKKPAAHKPEVAELYRRTNFKGFFYRKGDTLPFNDNSIEFIYSEHFFEHLFFDEALALLKECNRIMKPYGVIRTCVPDSDYRTYEPPEPEGYPDINMPITHPDKHKTRWSVYLLAKALKDAGFEPVPLRYCDKLGQYTRFNPLDIKETYANCPDEEMIFNLSYITRIDSLLVDGIKKP